MADLKMTERNERTCFEDLELHFGRRQQLIQEIDKELKLPLGIKNTVYAAFNKVPRHFFMKKIHEKKAYNNAAFEIDAGQTISKPTTVIYQTHLLQLTPKDKVLEIGTGSGFQTCILAELANQIYTVERQKQLFDNLKDMFEQQPFRFFNETQPSTLKKRFFNIHFKWGDGLNFGFEQAAPFDKILITCAAPNIVEPLVKQLKINGIMVLPIDEDMKDSAHKQRMTRITKLANGELNIEKLTGFTFVPFIEGKQAT